MSRKQNSLMRFSRTERLAQLSKQEVVIERKKREIQAKIEAQKKKETEEAFRKLEASSEEKKNDLNYSKKNSWKRDVTDKDKEKFIDAEKQDSLKNAFSNDGTFLDHFKKMSQSNFSLSNSDVEKKIGKKKDFGTIDDYRQSEDKERENLCSRKPLDSNIQLQLPPPGVVQLVPQHQMVPLMQPLIQNPVPMVPSSSSVQVSAVQPMVLSSVPQFTTNEIQLKAISSPPFSQSTQSMHSTPFSNTVTSPAATEEKVNETEKNSYLPGFKETSSPQQSFSASSQNFPASSFAKSPNKNLPPLSHKKTEPILKGHTDSVSMTFKNNATKKLEMIANPLGDDDDDDVPDNHSSKKRAQMRFRDTKKKITKDLHHNLKLQSPFPFSSQNEEYSRISSAFFNEEHEFGGEEWKQRVENTAKAVAQCGEEFEAVLSKFNENEPSMRFLTEKKSREYMIFREKVQQYREQILKEEKSDGSDKQKTQLCASDDKDSSIEKKSDKLDNFSMKTEMQENSCSKNNDGYQGDNEEESGSCKFSEKKKSQKNENESTNLDETSTEELKVERRKRKRKSRWGDVATNSQPAVLTSNLSLQSGKLPAPKTNLLSQLTRSDPGLIQYAKQTFGSTNLSEEDWKKAEDHYKINLLYQDLIKKRAEIKKLEKAGKFKYEYDSDEDVEGGTWEHKLRQQEMMATQLWAEELTRQAAGKHHIGDFLPPEELERFMEKYNAVKEGREPDLSDYKEFKLKEDNVGYRLLQKMGWNEGQGLGQDGSGMTHPVNKAATRHENQGLGLERPDGLEAGDDEYDAYRKRMMLAYRFRPNPLNNPRRPYY